MNPRRIARALVVTPLLVVACGTSNPPPPAQPTVVAAPSYYVPYDFPPPVASAAPTVLAAPVPTTRTPATNGSCAGDATWVAQVGGKPQLSNVMRFDAMRRRGNFGPETPILTYNDFTDIRRTSEEKYEWLVGTREEHNLVVLRGASGNVPKGYGPAKTHPSGVLEHPPIPKQYSTRDMTLFVFPDGTWVRSEGAETERVRTAFALPGKAPPLPTADADVAWEVCGVMDVNELFLPFDVWTIEGERVAVRLFASRKEGELVYPFASPELAARAAAEQASRCGRGACPWMLSSSVEGPLVRYGISVLKPPTTGRTVLEVALPWQPSPNPPPANTTVVPGTPPSGIYQQWVDVRSDTCPTHATGARYPMWLEPIFVTHKNGAPVADLHSVDPRARGMFTTTTVKDVELAAGKTGTHEIRHLCPDYVIARKMTVLSATGDTIRVRNEVRHIGNSCKPHLPSNCSNESIITWKVARRNCDGRCDATLVGPMPPMGEVTPPKLDVKCVCP